MSLESSLSLHWICKQRKKKQEYVKEPSEELYLGDGNMDWTFRRISILRVNKYYCYDQFVVLFS